MMQKGSGAGGVPNRLPPYCLALPRNIVDYRAWTDMICKIDTITVAVPDQSKNGSNVVLSSLPHFECRDNTMSSARSVGVPRAQ